MIQALKSYDKSFAEGMMARTSFFLADDPIIKTLKPVENEEEIRNSVISEICNNLNIPTSSYNNKKQDIINYLDDELDKSTRLDEKTEKEILTKLSARGELPTDLYTVKWQENAIVNNFKDLRNKDQNLIMQAIKTPDLSYNFGINYGESIFAKYYKDKYEYHNFFLLIVGKREGLVFTVDQVWWLQNDLLAGNTFSNALELLRYFVENFGVEVNCKGETSKMFIDVNVQSKNEFKIDMKKIYKSKKGTQEVVTCHFVGQENDNKYSVFFAIDIEKYKDYLMKYVKHRLKR